MKLKLDNNKLRSLIEIAESERSKRRMFKFNGMFYTLTSSIDVTKPHGNERYINLKVRKGTSIVEDISLFLNSAYDSELDGVFKMMYDIHYSEYINRNK